MASILSRPQCVNGAELYYIEAWIFPIAFSGAINKQTLLPELHKHGIAFEVRPLNVGDFLWVAREKGESRQDDHIMSWLHGELD